MFSSNRTFKRPPSELVSNDYLRRSTVEQPHTSSASREGSVPRGDFGRTSETPARFVVHPTNGRTLACCQTCNPATASITMPHTVLPHPRLGEDNGMTPEERVRMNELCAAIQEEKDYGNFAGMLREMSELISRKEQRRFKDHPALVWNRNRPFKTVEATVNKIVPTGVARHPEKVEISITPADYLFREVRIE